MIKMTMGERIFNVVNIGFMILLIIAMVYPFWYIVMYSLSNPQLAASGGLFLTPEGFSWESYRIMLNNASFLSGFRVSFIVTIGGTALGLFFTATTAYAISKKRLRARTFFTLLILFTMLFDGGIVPNYMLIRGLGLLDTYLALILPLAIAAWNVLIMRTFFANLPEELEESAKIDGASDLMIFFKIILPLSKAVLATIGLFLAVNYWNDFFSSILYISDKNMWSLQAVLRDIIESTQASLSSSGASIGYQQQVSPTTVKMAAIIIATLPILLVYPFIQKHFVKGALIGSVKG